MEYHRSNRIDSCGVTYYALFAPLRKYPNPNANPYSKFNSNPNPSPNRVHYSL